MHSQSGGAAAALAPIIVNPPEIRRFPVEPARPRPGAALDGPPTPLIVVSPFDEDFISLLDILKPSEWAVYWSSNHSDALKRLRASIVPVVLCDRERPEGDWRSLVAGVDGLAHPPRIIITAVLADDRLWAEALNLGAHDVLQKPFQADEVIRVVSYARIFWNAAREEKRRSGNRAKRA